MTDDINDIIDELIDAGVSPGPLPSVLGDNIVEWYMWRHGRDAIARSNIAGREMAPDEAIKTSRCTKYMRNGEPYYFSDMAVGVLSNRQATLCELIEDEPTPEVVEKLIDAVLACKPGTPEEWSSCVARKTQG